MLRIRSLKMLAIALGLATAVGSASQLAGTEFSAQMVQKGPKGDVSSGKMYVGNDRMRMEMTQSGQQVVHIVDETKQVDWLLYPAQHSYMERRGKGEAPRREAGSSPCAGFKGVTCRQLGHEKISGRDTVKWEMSFAKRGKTLKGIQWIDTERGIPLRQKMPDGVEMELRFVGMDTVDGRKVEKWEMITSRGNEAPTRSLQWYDPQLKLAVREEFPGGYVKQLTDIRVGKQPDYLFSIPAGYKRIAVPSGQQQDFGGGRGAEDKDRYRGR